MSHDIKKKAVEIIKILKKTYPNAKVALEYSNPLELLVATMLSAQCTDERVNKVTTSLFKKYKTAEDYAKADINEFERDIKSTGFYHSKAKNIIAAAKMIVEKFNSKIPNRMQDLIQLPGVARKTANIVLGNAYGVVEGIAVDTHVMRLSHRLALSESDDPEIVERELMNVIPKTEWFKFTYLLMEHGRKICTAKKPLCKDCILSNICPSAFTFN